MVAESKTDHGVPVELVEQNSVSFRNRPKFWIAIANLAFSNIFGAAPSCWNGDYLFGLNNSNFLKYVTSMGIEYGDLQDREGLRKYFQREMINKRMREATGAKNPRNINSNILQ